MKISWRRAWQPTPVYLPGEFSWTEELGGLQSVGSQRVRHNWRTEHIRQVPRRRREPGLLKGWAWLCLQWYHLHPGWRRGGPSSWGPWGANQWIYVKSRQTPGNGWVSSQWDGPPQGRSGRPRAPKGKPIKLVIGVLPPAHHLESSSYSLGNYLLNYWLGGEESEGQKSTGAGS